MNRGDIVVAAAPGDYGKPRPALIVQHDAFDALPSVTVLPLTSSLEDAPLVRVPIRPTAGNGLKKPSQAMVDKVLTLPRSKVGRPIGRLDEATMQAVNAALGRFLGLLD